MIHQVCAVYDSKARCFFPPFYVSHLDVARRTFADVARNPEHQIGRNPGDFTLFHLGTFDDDSGRIELRAAMDNLGLASQLKGEAYVRQVA